MNYIKKMSGVVVAAVLAGVVFLLNQCKKKGETEIAPTTKWVILAYCDGNNDLDISQNGTSFTIEDIQELEKIGSTDEVKIIAALGSLKTGGIVKYYYIQQYDNELPDQISSKVLKNLGTKDMSDPQTLTDFINYVVNNYPAKHYLLIIDEQGAGWRGVCLDEQNGAGDVMKIQDLANAIPNNKPMDLIVFHACLMSMAEVAYELRDKANYLVACEFVMPMQSVLGSEEWVGALVQNPGMTPQQLASKIVEAVYNAGNNKGKLVHMAATDLTQMDGLAAAIADFGNNLVTETGNYWNEVLDAWGNTHYTQYDDPTFVDLREFAKNVKNEPNIGNIPLIKNSADALINQINQTVFMTMTNVPALTRGGLTIYLPSSPTEFDSVNYVKLAFKSTNWHSFISKFVHSTGGGGGGNQVTITGTVQWPGHQLSNACIAFIDTSHTNAIWIVAPTQVDPSTGAFTITFQISGPLEAYVEAWDDVDGNGDLSAGDGLGWYDANGDQSWNDMLTFNPGDQLTGITITLQTYLKNKKAYHPKTKIKK